MVNLRGEAARFTLYLSSASHSRASDQRSLCQKRLFDACVAPQSP